MGNGNATTHGLARMEEVRRERRWEKQSRALRAEDKQDRQQRLGHVSYNDERRIRELPFIRSWPDYIVGPRTVDDEGGLLLAERKHGLYEPWPGLPQHQDLGHRLYHCTMPLSDGKK